MRILVYNIAYGTGAPGAMLSNICTMHRYLRTSQDHLDSIIDFIHDTEPDIVGLIEVDTGSYRTNFVNQAELIAGRIRHCCESHVKYGHSFFAHSVPILRKQANAILTKKRIPEKNFHFLPVGFKRLIIEADLGFFRFFLVHLSLNQKSRKIQLSHLAELGKDAGPLVIAGDFNTFNGESELDELKDALGLINPNKNGTATYPSWKPRKQLDYILYSKSLKIKRFGVSKVRYSDHLPLMLDIEKE